MQLTINGETHDFEIADSTLTTVIAHLGLAGKPVVVELNQQAVLPGDHDTTRLNDGDALEIVTIAAGG